MPAWLLIMDCEGLSVLTAWAAGKFVADLVRRWDGLVDVTPGTGEFTKGVAVEFAAVEEAA